MKFIGKDLIILPSLHDLEVDKIVLKEDSLTLFFMDISEFDTIVNQNIKANTLELKIDLFDYDFCCAKIHEHLVLGSDVDFINYKKDVKATIYSIDEFIKVTNHKDFYMTILDMAVSYQKVIIQTDSFLGQTDLELSIKSIEFKWN